MPKALLLHQESDNHPPAITVDASDTLSLSVVLNRETRNNYETEAEIVIVITIATTDLETKTETILDPMIEVDHKTKIDPEVMTIILKIKVILENEIAIIPIPITIED